MMFRAARLLVSAMAKSRAAGEGGSSSSTFVSRFSTSTNFQRLAGKVAVITGAASGIGKVTAAEFIRNGAKVILADVQDDLGRATAAELGPDAAYTRCDVTDEAQVAAAVDVAVARHGHLDVMFNNAGITGNYAGAPVESMDLSDFDRVMAVNARGVLAGIKHAARVMVPARRGGCILCMSSTAGALGGSGPHAYSASKTTVVGLVRSTAWELGSHGVRVNAISPYAVASPMGMRSVADMLPGASEEETRRVIEQELNEMGGGVVLRAEDVARAAVFLASDDAKYVNGHNFMVDGGFSVGKRLNMPA